MNVRKFRLRLNMDTEKLSGNKELNDKESFIATGDSGKPAGQSTEQTRVRPATAQAEFRV